GKASATSAFPTDANRRDERNAQREGGDQNASRRCVRHRASLRLHRACAWGLPWGDPGSNVPSAGGITRVGGSCLRRRLLGERAELNGDHSGGSSEGVHPPPSVRGPGSQGE